MYFFFFPTVIPRLPLNIDIMQPPFIFGLQPNYTQTQTFSPPSTAPVVWDLLYGQVVSLRNNVGATVVEHAINCVLYVFSPLILSGTSRRTFWTSSQNCCRVLSSFRCHLKLSDFHEIQHMGWSNISRCGMCWIQIQRAYKILWFLLCGRSHMI